MSGYSNEVQPHVSTVDEFIKEKQEITESHLLEINTLKKDILSLKTIKEKLEVDIKVSKDQLAYDIKTSLDQLQTYTKAKIKETDTKLNELYGAIASGEQTLEQISSDIQKKTEKLTKLLEKFAEDRSNLDSKQRDFKREKADFDQKQTKLHGRQIELHDQRIAFKEERVVFNKERDEFNGQRRIFNKEKNDFEQWQKDFKQEKADFKITWEKNLAHYEQIKTNALQLKEASIIDANEKIAFDDAKIEQGKETKRLKAWELELTKKDDAIKVGERALAYRRSVVSKREKAVRDAEKNITNKEEENG